MKQYQEINNYIRKTIEEMRTATTEQIFNRADCKYDKVSIYRALVHQVKIGMAIEDGYHVNTKREYRCFRFWHMADRIFERDIMMEAFEEMDKLHKEIIRKNNRLLKAIDTVRPGMAEKVELFIDEEDLWEFNPMPLAIVKKPLGNKRGRIWVNQWAVGDSGDSFAGSIYFMVKKGKYLGIPFAS